MPHKMELTVTIKNKLRVQMAEVGCKSLRALEEATGISKNTLHALEKGENTNLKLENVCKLLWFFDCKFEDLFLAEVTSNEPDHWDDLSDETQQKILEAKAESDASRNAKSA
jgi:DNA-binding Xre family transcriptional regulator